MTELPAHLAADPLARDLAERGWPEGRIARTCERAAILEHDAGAKPWKAEAIATRDTWEPTDGPEVVR